MILHVFSIIASAVGIWLFSSMLSKGTDAIGKHFRINPGVRGATLDAVSSSFPEFCAVVIALYAGAFDAGVGTIAGSALYNVLVIPAASVLVGGPLTVEKRVVRRDGFFYVAVVIALIVALWFGPETKGATVTHFVSPWVGGGAVLLYLGYVAVLVMQARRSGKDAPEPASAGEQEPFRPLRTAALLLLGIAGIGVATHFLVHSSLAVFARIGLSEAIAGVTILAAATSLPDTLLSVFAARRGDHDGAVANAFGSNSFDILICLGLPIAITGGVAVNWGATWPILIFLLASTLGAVFFVMTDWTLTRREAAIMGATYVLFNVLAFTGVF